VITGDQTPTNTDRQKKIKQKADEQKSQKSLQWESGLFVWSACCHTTLGPTTSQSQIDESRQQWTAATSEHIQPRESTSIHSSNLTGSETGQVCRAAAPPALPKRRSDRLHERWSPQFHSMTTSTAWARRRGRFWGGTGELDVLNSWSHRSNSPPQTV